MWPPPPPPVGTGENKGTHSRPTRFRSSQTSSPRLPALLTGKKQSCSPRGDFWRPPGRAPATTSPLPRAWAPQDACPPASGRSGPRLGVGFSSLLQVAGTRRVSLDIGARGGRGRRSPGPGRASASPHGTAGRAGCCTCVPRRPASPASV